MKKAFIAICIALFGGANASAVVVQHALLNDGSILHGYIQSQDGNGSICFYADNATMQLLGTDVDITNERPYGVKELDKTWVEWAEKNDAFEGIGDGRTLMLADLKVKSTGEMMTRVRVIQRGAMVRFISYTPKVYTLAWKDIQSIRGDKRSKTALTGINRVYMLKDGTEHEGEYAEETDSTLSLYMAGNVVESFKIDDVVKYSYRPINPNQDIFAQSELLDVVNTSGGSVIRGIIIEQNYKSLDDKENYILVRQKNGEIKSVKLSELQTLSKESNEEYSPKFDILLHVGDVVVNRNEVKFVGTQEASDVITLDSLVTDNIASCDESGTTNVVVEHRNEEGENREDFQLVKVTKVPGKKGTVSFSFSYRDLVNATIRPVALETSINHTTRAEYHISGKGVYALFDAKNKRAIPLIVKSK